MTIGVFHIIGIVITLALIAGVGVYSGRKVSDASDFTTGGGKAGAWLVCGAVMGSLVSGQATVGTAQLAFQYGMSAWWFTLGAGIGCLVLAIGYVIPLRHSGSVTLLQVISNEYGKTAGYIGSVLCSIGIFISVIAQVISAMALITTIFPVSSLVAALISIIIMTIYVVFGGAWGAGMGGVVKLILLYAACIIGCALVLGQDGLSGLLSGLQNLLVGTSLGEVAGVTTEASFNSTFLSLIARGAAKDIGSGVSLLLGVLSTQTYAQAIWSAKSDSAARKGSLLSACLIPPIGIACILIGLYMRKTCITTAEIEALTAAGQAIPTGLTELASTAQVFPMFVVEHMPALVGGIVLGTLFITVVGGGAGLSLGVATILVNDIFKKLTRKLDEPTANLHVTRITLVCVLVIAALVAVVVPGAVINDFGFLSMGLRGAVVFIPMTFALFLPGRIKGSWAVASVVVGPVVVLLGNLVDLAIDPLFIGIAACLVIMLIGVATGKKKLA
jgi:SSS family solute:Na+ symporter